MNRTNSVFIYDYQYSILYLQIFYLVSYEFTKNYILDYHFQTHYVLKKN